MTRLMKSTDRSDELLAGDAYRLLLRIGLLGIESGNTESAVRIGEALRLVRPDLPQAHGLLAMCQLNMGQDDEAIRLLESTLGDFPDFQLGRALLGVSMKISHRSGWRHHLEAVIDDARDEFAVGMANEVLGRPLVAIEDAPSPVMASPGAHVVWA